jgi:dihydroorotate dehydrogenase
VGRPYDLLFRHGATRVDAEVAHRIGMRTLGLASWGLGHVASLRPSEGSPRAWSFLGHSLATPLGLAAGLDKDAEAVLALGRLGFAAVEVGTVTASPQPGNPRPRLFRLPADRALVNRMGFNNAGSEAAAARLARLGPPSARVPGCPLVGVNIGKSKVAEGHDATVADHVLSARRLGPWADYVVVNVSSPNTPGLRDLQGVDALEPLLAAVRAALDDVTAARVPLLVKITADLDDAGVDAVADMALATGLDGVVATNTTLARDGLRTDPAEVAAAGAGGLSGAPLVDPARAVLARLRARVGERVTLVSVGGVDSGGEADARLRAGASLVQAYTGFIYGGPGWPRRIARELAAARA